MELSGVTFQGPAIDDMSFLAALPQNVQDLLQSLNGFILFGGGLHVRGVCADPAWHSLQRVTNGQFALHDLYGQVRTSDVPFAQDCIGDQFLLRDGVVLRLYAETGDIEKVTSGLSSFFEHVNNEPVEFLGLEPLLQLHDEGGGLEPGQLLHVYPPFCTAEAADGVSLQAVPSDELLQFHADFAAQLPGDGSPISVQVED